jgi:hypothetical protein
MEYKEYDIDNLLDQDDAQICDELAFNYTGYIDDAIREVADNNVSIWNEELFANLEKLYNAGLYDEAMDDIGPSGNLLKDIQYAWYLYNEKTLRDNLDAILFNHALKYIRDVYPQYENKINAEDLEDLALQFYYDFAELEEAVDDLVKEVK